MSKSRCWMASVAVVVTLFVTDFLIHGLLLKDSYEQTAHLWRPMPEMQGMMWTMWVIYVVDALVLPYLYSKGYEAGRSAVGQGFRFGALIGVLMASGMSLGTYFMIPLPASIAVTWFVVGLIQFVLVGIAIAFIYR